MSKWQETKKTKRSKNKKQWMYDLVKEKTAAIINLKYLDNNPW